MTSQFIICLQFVDFLFILKYISNCVYLYVSSMF